MKSPANKVITKIFEYENYRTFLKNYFAEQKTLKRMFSHRYFAQLAGFSSSSFCSHVMEGKKNLSGESIDKMITAMKLEGKMARYFKTLVLYNQSKKLHDREFYFNELTKIRKSTNYYRVNKDQLLLYDEWYYSVIRELVVYSNWNNDFETLGKLVVPPVSKEKAKKAFESLIAVGLLIRTDNGQYQQSSPLISAEDAPPVFISKLKKEFMLKAIEVEETIKKPHKYSSSATLSMSMESFSKAKQMIDELRQELLMMALDDDNVEKIFQANFQIFPLSQQIEKPENTPDE